MCIDYRQLVDNFLVFTEVTMSDLLEDAAIDDHLAKARFYGQAGENPTKWCELVVTVQRLHLY